MRTSLATSQQPLMGCLAAAFAWRCARRMRARRESISVPLSRGCRPLINGQERHVVKVMVEGHHLAARRALHARLVARLILDVDLHLANRAVLIAAVPLPLPERRVALLAGHPGELVLRQGGGVDEPQGPLVICLKLHRRNLETPGHWSSLPSVSTGPSSTGRSGTS